jgi:23S rRNA pseudouridine1911/1915/1917 synthase
VTPEALLKEWIPAAAGLIEASYNTAMLDVLYEDNHLLAVNKPAMLPTMGVADDRESLLTVAKDYVRRKYNKPGNVYLGIVSRLDAPVTGVVLLARTSKAAARLSEQFRERNVEKVYWAVVEGRIDPRAGRLVDFIRKDERHRKVHITVATADGAQRAELEYRVLGSSEDKERSQRDKVTWSDDKSSCLPFSVSLSLTWASWLEVRLLTGRKHQIRVQLSHAGFPIVGDRKYGGVQPFSPGIALHSRRLVVEHPVGKTRVVIEAPPPPSWQRFFDAGR